MISERLKKVRELLGYEDNQKGFAEELDMKQGSYSDVERGKTKSISKKMIRNLYLKFGVNEDFLLNGNPPILLDIDKKEEKSLRNDYNIAEQLNQFFTIIKIKDEHINKLINQQNELIQQQKSLVEAILSLTKQEKK